MTRPDLTLDSVLTEQAGPDPGGRPAGAMLARMVFERGGVSAIKELLASGAGNDDLRSTVVRLLGEPWPRIAAEWRRRIEALGDEPPTAALPARKQARLRASA